MPTNRDQDSMRSEPNDRFSSSDADQPITAAPAGASSATPPEPAEGSGKPAVVQEILIEEVSIDGMCGVY